MLKLLLLGHPQIVLNDQPVTEFASQKALALLCYLAVRQGAHARDALAGLLWGEMPDERARANLRMALYNLQQRLPGYLKLTRLNAAFNHESPYWLDTEQLEDADHNRNLDRAGLDGRNQDSDLQKFNLVSASLSLYRGEFLEGLFIGGAPAFEEWLLIERERLRQLALNTSQKWAEYALQQGRYPLAVETLRFLLNIEPWQESAHYQLMLALTRLATRPAPWPNMLHAVKF